MMEALKAGRFTWSQGPEIRSLAIQDNALLVKTSPVEKIFVTVEGRDSYKAVVNPGEALTEGPVPPDGRGGVVPGAGSGQPGSVRRNQRLFPGPAVRKGRCTAAKRADAKTSALFLLDMLFRFPAASYTYIYSPRFPQA